MQMIEQKDMFFCREVHKRGLTVELVRWDSDSNNTLLQTLHCILLAAVLASANMWEIFPLCSYEKTILLLNYVIFGEQDLLYWFWMYGLVST